MHYAGHLGQFTPSLAQDIVSEVYHFVLAFLARHLRSFVVVGEHFLESVDRATEEGEVVFLGSVAPGQLDHRGIDVLAG